MLLEAKWLRMIDELHHEKFVGPSAVEIIVTDPQRTMKNIQDDKQKRAYINVGSLCGVPYTLLGLGTVWCIMDTICTTMIIIWYVFLLLSGSEKGTMETRLPITVRYVRVLYLHNIMYTCVMLCAIFRTTYQSKGNTTPVYSIVMSRAVSLFAIHTTNLLSKVSIDAV